MIPSLASAGYLEPLDQYMKQADFKIEAVADYANFMTYKGQTYGIPTDGNVHIQYVRKDLLEDPDNRKKFADKHGKELKFPETWEDDLRIQETLMDPSKDLYGSSAQPCQWPDLVVHDLLQRRRLHLRRRYEPHARYAGRALRRRHLSAGQEGRAPESAGWGTPQMIPRISQGHVVSCQYWDGTAKLNENPANRMRRQASGSTAWCRARISRASASIGRSHRRSPRC